MATDIRPGIRFARTAVPAALVIVAVILTGLALSSAIAWTSREMELLREVSRLHTPALDSVALAINWLFGPRVAVVIVLVGAIIVAGVSRRVSTAAYFLVIVVVPRLGSEAVKLIVHRARPDIASLAHPLVFEPGGLSFPSGHTAFAACLVLGVLLVVRNSRARTWLIAAGVLISLTTAGSRVYLGVHYPTDVLASLVYSIAAVALVNALWALIVVPHWSERRPVTDAMSAYRGVTDAR